MYKITSQLFVLILYCVCAHMGGCNFPHYINWNYYNHDHIACCIALVARNGNRIKVRNQ